MANNSPLISILLPVYNGEKTLRATLESLLNQSFANFELLIGIDGTKDKSKNIAESFKDKRIKIIEHPKNLGLADNVNSLIVLADPQSEYYAMAEQDDIYVQQRLEWQLQVIQQNPEVGLVSGIAEFIGDGGTVLFPGILVHGKQFPQGEALFKYLYEHQLKVVNTCMLWRKSVHQQEQLRFNNHYGNFNVDWDFILRFALISKVYGIPKVLVHMNRKKTVGSVTTNNKAAQHQATRQLLKNFKKSHPQLVDATLYRKALKQHRKIELGHHSKFGIVVYGLYYAICYLDTYFLKYIVQRFKNYLN
ncbi:glycosyltransferase [Paucihalobacter ruber]|uniref:Glycosyltransferase n=1 Tax=Paucihalobacter ruber TaxID=2567861 RepID=A0A506PKY9_9FLAO|nr:glycosyltransferase [Paucihalobacter ruber]TPV33852.1 glycosyltransferase [Paucihalobacter ruber]